MTIKLLSYLKWCINLILCLKRMQKIKWCFNQVKSDCFKVISLFHANQEILHVLSGIHAPYLLPGAVNLHLWDCGGAAFTGWCCWCWGHGEDSNRRAWVSFRDGSWRSKPPFSIIQKKAAPSAQVRRPPIMLHLETTGTQTWAPSRDEQAQMKMKAAEDAEKSGLLLSQQTVEQDKESRWRHVRSAPTPPRKQDALIVHGNDSNAERRCSAAAGNRPLHPSNRVWSPDMQTWAPPEVRMQIITQRKASVKIMTFPLENMSERLHYGWKFMIMYKKHCQKDGILSSSLFFPFYF